MIDAILYQTTRIISLYFEKYFSLPLQFFSLTQFFLYLIFVEFFFFFIFIYNFEFNCQLPCHFPYFTLISFQPFSGWIWVFFFIFHLIKKKKKNRCWFDCRENLYFCRICTLQNWSFFIIISIFCLTTSTLLEKNIATTFFLS